VDSELLERGGGGRLDADDAAAIVGVRVIVQEVLE